MERGDFIDVVDITKSILNHYSENYTEYVSFKPHFLTVEQYETIATSISQFPTIISKWQSNINANDSTVHILSVAKSDRLKRQKERLKEQIYNLFYTTLSWSNIEMQVVELIAKQGNAVLMFNKDGRLIVESIFSFNVYWDATNKISRYVYVKNGVEIEGMKNLQHGIEIYHIKDTISQTYPVSPSRIDNAFSSILLDNKAVNVNTKIFAGGMLGTVLANLDPQKFPKISDETRDNQGMTWRDRFTDWFNDRFAGARKAGRVSFLAGVENIHELGRNNRDAQFLELLKQLTPERIAWAFSLTLADFGGDTRTTYNNVATFDDALYDKFGRPLEKILDDARNNWILRKFFTQSSFYIKYNEPQDPNKSKELENVRLDYEKNIITLNEAREAKGYEPIPNGDTFFIEMVRPQPTQQEPKEKAEEDKTEEVQQDFKKKGFFESSIEVIEYKTKAEQVLTSKEYVNFKKRLEKAIGKQIKAYTGKIEQEGKTAKLPKLETYINFKELESWLFVFANKERENLRSGKAYSFDVYPEALYKYFEDRTEALLKGNELFESVDVETSSQILNIISENAGESVKELASIITDRIQTISQTRAELIAQTEVANAIEETRFQMYKQESPKAVKRWFTVLDDKVREEHRGNERQGEIPINQAFSSGEMRAGEKPRCRCTVLYDLE